MPHASARYRFEFRLLTWAETFSRDLCGSRCSFFIGFRDDGSLRRVYLAPPGQLIDGPRKARLAETYQSWFLYSPHQVTGSGYIEWLQLPRDVAERWLKRPLTPEDFFDVRTTTSRDSWPESWRVIVG